MRIFPPEGIHLKEQGRNRSIWRETCYLLSMIRQAIVPVISLYDGIRKWKGISIHLRERPRARELQALEFT